MGTTEIIQAHPAICQRCRQCVRECPVKAVRVTEELLEIDTERCVYCGQCVSLCSQAALVEAKGDESIPALVNATPTVAVVSWEAMVMWPRFTWSMWHEALTTLGFYAVESGEIGTQLTAKAYRSLLASRRPEQTLIRSSCTAVVRYIEQFRPELVGLLAPIAPPYVAQARLIAELYPEHPRVVAITPCLALRTEVGIEGEPLVAVLSPSDLMRMFQKRKMDTPAAGRPDGAGLDDVACGRTRFERSDEQVITARGLSEIMRVLPATASGTPTGGFYDLLACGRCAFDFAWPAAAPALSGAENVIESKLEARVCASAGFSARPVREDPVDTARLDTVLFSAGLGEREWRLNCAICGYATCEDHARAVIRGYSDWSACLPSQKRRFAATSAELRDSAPVDPLTGLMHRQALIRVIENERRRHKRYQRPLSLLLMEVDGFDILAERHGSASADKLLVLLSQLLLRNLREVDVPARGGRSRFVVVLPETDIRAAQTLLEKTKERAASTVFWLGEDGSVRLTLTGAVTEIGGSEADPATVLVLAEEALEQGRPKTP